MTIDVEDYFQVSAFERYVERDRWEAMPRRVERNTREILELLDDAGARGTFFTLAWIARRHPQLVREIVAAGHELASHGMAHVRVHGQSRAEFLADARDSRHILEDVGGCGIVGYRAASFSIGKRTPWAFEALVEAGYRYSSSVNPIAHDHYGVPDAPRAPYRVAGDALLEIPMTTLSVLGRRLPCSGGGFFRLLPYRYFRWGFARVNAREGRPVVFYLHPWELDPDQPRVAGLDPRTRFRHYVNLRRTRPRLARLLRDFRWDRMDRVFVGCAPCGLRPAAQAHAPAPGARAGAAPVARRSGHA